MMTPTTPITLSAEQERARSAVAEWLKSRDKPYFILHGFGGTGKSTVASALASSHSGPVYYLAYTGCAAQILRKRGLPCETIHSKIYLPAADIAEEAKKLEGELSLLDPEDEKSERRSRGIRKRLEELYAPDFVLRPTSPFQSTGLIVLDECSFVAEREARDLLSFKLPILVLGDPGQLPPVEGKGFFNGKPDFLLTEIHRQALDSPIIRLAALAREGKPLKIGKYGDSEIIRGRDLTNEHLLEANQVIVGRNATRISMNERVRELRGFSGVFPKANERLMCLRNNKQRGIFNGEIFNAVADTEFSEKYAQIDFDSHGVLNVHKECFTDPDVLKSWNYDKRKKAEEFTYAWVTTCHKFQGNQAENVVFVPDLFTWASAWEDRKKFLYTGISRAEKKIVIAI